MRPRWPCATLRAATAPRRRRAPAATSPAATCRSRAAPSWTAIGGRRRNCPTPGARRGAKRPPWRCSASRRPHTNYATKRVTGPTGWRFRCTDWSICAARFWRNPMTDLAPAAQRATERAAIEALEQGEHGNPFAFLGPHRDGDGLLVRAWLPGAERVELLRAAPGEARSEERRVGKDCGARGRPPTATLN